MNKIRQLIGEDLFRLIQLAALPFLHLVNLLQRKEGEKAHTFDNIGVVHISPVLIEVKGRRLIGIKPYRSRLGFSHLLAFGIQKQGNGHGVGVFTQFSSDQLCAAQHIAPLVVAAELHAAAVLLIQHIKIVALHDHVVEFQEA